MKYIVLAALGAAVTGFLLGLVICRRGLDGISRAQAASVTRQLFVVTLWACIAWISCSYAMAIYSMVKNNTFNGICLPSIALWKEDGSIQVIRRFGYQDFKGRLS